MKAFDVNVLSRCIVIWWIINARRIIERVSDAGVGHSETPEFWGNLGGRSHHGNVCLRCDDANWSLSNSLCVFITSRRVFNIIFVLGHKPQEHFWFIFILRVNVNVTSCIRWSVCEPCRMQVKENSNTITQLGCTTVRCELSDIMSLMMIVFRFIYSTYSVIWL